MAGKILFIISVTVCTALLSGCYYGSVTSAGSNWTGIEPSDTEDEFEVSVITAGGNNLAYQGEELIIELNPELIEGEVSIELVDDTNVKMILIDEYSGPFPFRWLIPEDFPPCESYRILVSEQYYKENSGIFGYSEEFAILTNFVSGLSDISVSSRSIEITLTDNGSVIDDDTVSVVLNGSVLFENLVLQGQPGTSLTLDLLKGKNTFGITAVNEGSVSPNTAEISFTDVVSGEAVQQWRLSEGETGTLSISAP